MANLNVLNHPLILHKLSKIRSVDTNTKDFRELVNEVASLMTYEMARDLKVKEVTVSTPICDASCYVLDKDIILVPILRAGLGMVEGVLRLLPQAKVGHVGLYRDEESLQPKEYYSKFPENIANSTVIVLDPMLATGGSAAAAIDMVKKVGAKSIMFIGLVGAPEGVELLQKAHPDVDIFLAALDEMLNENGYIVPGLGDCGDRLFGTK